MTCDKCSETATWGFSTSTQDDPVGEGLKFFCETDAKVLQSMVQHVQGMTLEQKQNLLSRLRPLSELLPEVEVV